MKANEQYLLFNILYHFFITFLQSIPFWPLPESLETSTDHYPDADSRVTNAPTGPQETDFKNKQNTVEFDSKRRPIYKPPLGKLSLF